MIVLAAVAHTLLSGASPVDLLDARWDVRFVLPWALIALGIAVRLLGAGNLRKSREITDRGIYQMVRHPLYLGSLAFFLAFFLTVGDVIVGLILFVALVAGVYYPTMISEERYLIRTFPEQFARYDPPPRLVPDPRRLRNAIATDGFKTRVAYENLGFRGVWFALGLPAVLLLISWVQSLIPS